MCLMSDYHIFHDLVVPTENTRKHPCVLYAHTPLVTQPFIKLLFV
jgi:hypothetical protein